MYDLLIKNGTVYDGTGKPGSRFDVAISGGKIANIAEEIKTGAKEIIEAGGMAVTPGFIDIQNHSDAYWQLLENPLLSSLTSQGFTSILVGHCGASIAPLPNNDSLRPVQKWRSLSGLNADWQNVKELAAHINKEGLGLNAYTLIGYETLRRSLIGDQVRSLSVEERKTIIRMLGEALRSGARGVSFGLSYAHEQTALEQELKDVCELVASHQGLVSIHLRSEGSHIIDAISEAIHLASQTGARIKISHFKIRGRHNWPMLEHALNMIERARHQHIDIHFDIYPYHSTWQVLYNYLPSWATSGGREHMMAELGEPTQRRKILDYLRDYNLGVSEFVLASTANNLPGVGKRIGDIAKGMECTSEEAVLYLLEHGGSEVMVFNENINPDSVDELLKHPLSVVATDGGGFPLPGQPTFSQLGASLIHPRCYGTAPAFLRRVIDGKLLPLETAIHKLTGLPAQLLQLKDRGVLKVGNEADMVVFDPKVIKENATLTDPFQQSSGINHVLVHGQEVITFGHIQEKYPGRFITK